MVSVDAGGIRVEHDATRSQFTAYDGDAEVGHIRYVTSGETLDLVHTEVDPAARRRGIGKALVRGALDQLRSKGQSMRPTCPFIKSFVEQHPEYLSR